MLCHLLYSFASLASVTSSPQPTSRHPPDKCCPPTPSLSPSLALSAFVPCRRLCVCVHHSCEGDFGLFLLVQQQQTVLVTVAEVTSMRLGYLQPNRTLDMCDVRLHCIACRWPNGSSVIQRDLCGLPGISGRKFKFRSVEQMTERSAPFPNSQFLDQTTRCSCFLK